MCRYVFPVMILSRQALFNSLRDISRGYRFVFSRKASDHQHPSVARAPIPKKDIDTSSSHFEPLYDSFGRIHNYLRISLTERCTYCMPEEGVSLTPKPQLLTLDEIVHLVRIFAQNGIDKVRVTGGEPTIRPDIVDIIHKIKSVEGIKSLGMTTNGITLYRNAKELRAAGLDKSGHIEGGQIYTNDQKEGATFGFEKYSSGRGGINNVVIKDSNYVEMLSFIEWTKNRKLDVRFIEFMPFGGNAFDTQKFVSYKEMMSRVREYFGDNVIRLVDDPHDTTKAYKIKGYEGQFGFITSMSEHFCGTCNRLRITADGNLKVCLHGNKEVSMRDLLRSGTSDQELTDVIRSAVQRKKKQHAGMENLQHMPNRPMILIGG